MNDYVWFSIVKPLTYAEADSMYKDFHKGKAMYAVFNMVKTKESIEREDLIDLYLKDYDLPEKARILIVFEEVLQDLCEKGYLKVREKR